MPKASHSLLTVLFALLPWMIVGTQAAHADGTAPSASGAIQAPPSHRLPAVLDLKTAQRIALEANPSLSAARARAAQAREQVHQAWSRYLPRIEGSANAAHVRYPENQGTMLPSSGFSSITAGLIPRDREDVYSATLNAVLTLFDGFQREFALAASRFNEQGSKAAYREAQRVLLSAVADSYFSAQLARERGIIAEADEAFNQRQLQDAQAREALGAGSLSDVLNFHVQANLARAQKILAQQEYRVALTGLAALMGLPEGTVDEGTALAPLGDVPESLMKEPSVADHVTYALEKRPDVLQARFGFQAAQAGVGSAKSRFAPSINLFSTLEGSRTNSARMEQDDFGSTVGIAVVVPLFSGGEDYFRVREAQQAQREAESKVHSAAVDAVSQVQAAVAQILGAQEQLRLQEKNAALVRQTRDLVAKEYAAGQASLVRLTQAQRDLVQAQSQLALTRIFLENAWIRLHAATGRILEEFQTDAAP
ncbi:TolC family protein [Desulfosoma sp.]